eukprot:4381052-Pleurochrysis_carterae.AAC.2
MCEVHHFVFKHPLYPPAILSSQEPPCRYVLIVWCQLPPPSCRSLLRSFRDPPCALRAATTEAGTTPSPGSVPMYLALPKTTTHAASLQPGSATRHATALRPWSCGAMPTSRATTAGVVSGIRLDAAQAHLAASPVLDLIAVSMGMVPTVSSLLPCAVLAGGGSGVMPPPPGLSLPQSPRPPATLVSTSPMRHAAAP